MSSAPSPSPLPLIDRAGAYFRDLQDRIVAALEQADGGRFREDTWDRPGGGGGRSRVLTEGALFEKAGVNFSDVHGSLRPDMAGALPGQGLDFRATGISLVLHPRNPHVPTVHANFRRFEREGDASGAGTGVGWFGGGADLTPYYLRDEDAIHFHRTLQGACAQHEATFYPRFKAWCDRYFFIPHRQEPRGVGGLFFDYLGAGAEKTAGEPQPPAAAAIEQDPERLFDFIKTAGDAFLSAYLPIVDRRRGEAVTPEQRRWQLIRRGRYVEFNLVYDRGTIFGLKTDGRVESILMSLPSEVRWEYAHEPVPGTPEAATLAAIKSRRDWAT
jgi:coproporphyrinogen III oxidase